ncbi:MAG: SagB/ThcOx family dehydrogenase, partial [Candidatus Omnitrophica bacterium]|nr:SagB/ThcOx family dehydrogenase [Candidatus Omnitrophota bacterium]
MTLFLLRKYFNISFFLMALPICIYAQNLNTITLPLPQTQDGMPLMQALKERKSTREFSARELTLQTLSDLL